MKRVVLLLLLLMPLAMSRASGTYRVTFSLDDYEISTGDDGLTRVVPKRTGAFYSDDSAMPALPYSSYNILRPRGCVTTYTVDFDKLLLRDDVVMAANPVCVPADAIPLVDAGPEAAVSSLLRLSGLLATRYCRAIIIARSTSRLSCTMLPPVHFISSPLSRSGCQARMLEANCHH